MPVCPQLAGLNGFLARQVVCEQTGSQSHVSQLLNFKLTHYPASTKRAENARLGVETQRGAPAQRDRQPSGLKRFIGRPAILASPPPDEAG
jgi:hypothetical protein